MMMASWAHACSAPPFRYIMQHEMQACDGCLRYVCITDQLFCQYLCPRLMPVMLPLQDCHIDIKEEVVNELMVEEGFCHDAEVIMRVDTFKRCLLHVRRFSF